MLVPPSDVSILCGVNSLWDTMSDCAYSYAELRDQVVVGGEEYLQYFIDRFQAVINSKRRSSYINNFRDLITILEKRGYVGETNVAPLEEIVSLLPNSGILKDMISNYLFYRDRNRLRGSYVRRESTELPSRLRNNYAGSGRSQSSVAVTIRNSVLPEAALDCVCKGIGTNWKDLARNLSICEGDIDEIEQYPKKLKERAYECMKIFIKDTDPHKVRQKLLFALDKCGRRDLKEDVEEILYRT